MKFEESVFIQSPTAKVFKFLSNFRSHKKIVASVQETKLTSDGKMGLGAKLFHKSFFLGRKIETDSEVTAYVPEKEIKIESLNGPIPIQTRYLLEPKEEGTVVTMEYQVEPGSFFRMTESFLKPRYQEVVTDTLKTLKKLLEN
ncbi:MAG: SRPBCC family protein [Bacteroidota bacterium]